MLRAQTTGNLLEVVSVEREEGDEIVIHAMAMRHMYEGLLPEIGESDG